MNILGRLFHRGILVRVERDKDGEPHLLVCKDRLTAEEWKRVETKWMEARVTGTNHFYV